MIVVDANLLVALVSGDLRGSLVLQHFTDWLDRNVKLHAPSLAQYEVANALTRLIVGGAFRAEKVEEAWKTFCFFRSNTTTWRMQREWLRWLSL